MNAGAVLALIGDLYAQIATLTAEVQRLTEPHPKPEEPPA